MNVHGTAVQVYIFLLVHMLQLPVTFNLHAGILDRNGNTGCCRNLRQTLKAKKSNGKLPSKLALFPSLREVYILDNIFRITCLTFYKSALYLPATG